MRFLIKGKRNEAGKYFPVGRGIPLTCFDDSIMRIPFLQGCLPQISGKYLRLSLLPGHDTEDQFE